MLFSIITPTFNSEKTIKHTLDSVLNQTFSDYEYIIVDGLSSDHTLEIVDNYKEKFGNKLKVISESDNGLYEAMNKGINLAQGEIVCIVNSDDYFEKDTLESVYECYNTDYSYQIMYGMIRIIDKDENELSIVFNHHRNLLDGNMIAHPACFITKELYKKYGLYNTELKSASDLDFMLRVIKAEDVLFIPIYRVLSNFRLGGISQSLAGERESILVRYRHKVIPFKIYLIRSAKIILKNFFNALFKI